ncbi:MAG: YraN family protein [Telluria sp.]
MWPARLSFTQRKGQLGEQQALAYLQRNGLKLVETNFSCKAGEIDLIMREHDTLVFVEVRRRNGKVSGAAAESITPAKIRRIICAAQLYLARFPRMPACRIDVVAIDGDQLDWLRNAVEV